MTVPVNKTCAYEKTPIQLDRKTHILCTVLKESLAAGWKDSNANVNNKRLTHLPLNKKYSPAAVLTFSHAHGQKYS